MYGFSVVLGAVAGLGEGLMLRPKDDHRIDWSRLALSRSSMERHDFLGLAFRHVVHYRLLLIVKLHAEGCDARALEGRYWWNAHQGGRIRNGDCGVKSVDGDHRRSGSFSLSRVSYHAELGDIWYVSRNGAALLHRRMWWICSCSVSQARVRYLRDGSPTSTSPLAKEPGNLWNFVPALSNEESRDAMGEIDRLTPGSVYMRFVARS